MSPSYDDGYSPFTAAAALAGTLNDPNTPQMQKRVLLMGLRDTIVIAATALALHSTTEDKENDPTFEEDDRRNPAEIIEELSRTWYEIVGEEEWHKQIEDFLAMEGNHLLSQFEGDLSDLPTIDDSERNTNIQEPDPED